MTPARLYTHMDSPVGPLLLAGDGEALTLVAFQAGERFRDLPDAWRRDEKPFAEAIRQLHAYFAGELTQFDLPLAMHGTPFQKTVWTALRAIPFGETVSYGELAKRIGKPGASRAVGAANGANPLPIVAPCHRVIGADNSLTGFGGGLEIKRWLLAHESDEPPLFVC